MDDGMVHVKFRLEFEDLLDLMAGQEVEHNDGRVCVHLILADIGYSRMMDAFCQAVMETKGTGGVDLIRQIDETKVPNKKRRR